MRIEQNGSESVEVSVSGSFVIVQVPVTVPEEAPRDGAGFRFSIGSFRGREKELLIRTGAPAKLIFRIPKELFRPRERLSLEVVQREEGGSEKVLWTKRYEAGWTGKAPHLEPMPDSVGEAPEETA